jgi:DNA primase
MLGYSRNMDMIIFPYPDPDGQFIVGFQARSIEGKEFKNSTGTKKSQTLFGIQHHKWDSEVFLFESPIDSILAHQHEIPAISTMGANPSKTQITLLTSHYKTIYVVADNDSPGKAAAFKLCEKLDERGIMVVPPEGFKDIGEMPYDTIPQWADKVKNPVYNLLGEK